MSEDQDLVKDLAKAVEERLKKIEGNTPLDFSNLKDYLIASISSMHDVAEHGLQHIPMSCFRNASHDMISEDITLTLGLTSTALVLAMSLIPGEQKDQFRTLLMRQMRQDLEEEVQRRREEAKHRGMELGEMLAQLFNPRGSSHGHGGSTH